MEELTGFEPAIMVLQTISLTNLDTTPPEKNGWDVWIRTRACRSQSPVPYQLGYVPIYNIWWAEQDLNLQVVSDQRFSRLLPHQPGHTAYIWCVPRDSNPYSQKRTAPSRQRVYQIPPGTHIVFRYRRQTLNRLV